MRKVDNIVVYLHRNNITGKVYIGQTFNVGDRWRSSGKNYATCVKFYNAIKKYGWENFSHEILADRLNREEADRMEKEMIIKYDSINNGYNLKEGGWRGTLSKESLDKMSDTLKRGYLEHPERREKISKNRCFHGFSNETLEHMRLNHQNIIKIQIGDEIGGIRYWSAKCGASRETLQRIVREDGVEAVTEFIRERLSDPTFRYKRPDVRRRTYKAIKQYSKEEELISCWGSLNEAANQLEISASAISACLHGRTKTAGGYIWKF